MLDIIIEATILAVSVLSNLHLLFTVYSSSCKYATVVALHYDDGDDQVTIRKRGLRNQYF